MTAIDKANARRLLFSASKPVQIERAAPAVRASADEGSFQAANDNAHPRAGVWGGPILDDWTLRAALGVAALDVLLFAVLLFANVGSTVLEAGFLFIAFSAPGAAIWTVFYLVGVGARHFVGDTRELAQR